MTSYNCTDCGRAFPETFAYQCEECGGIYDLSEGILFDPLEVEGSLPGIWRYRSSFGLQENAPVVTLGEGNTPLAWVDIDGQKIGLKLEYLNPTGSYKDRLTAPLISHLKSLSVNKAVEDSSGNAGASFAAYAARAGIHASVYIPSYASGPKRDQIEAYGAEVVAVDGSRADTSATILELVETQGKVYASHAYLPQGLPGIATIAYELWDELRGAPGTIISPVGHGGLLMGIYYGFHALEKAGLIEKMPKLIGVQAENCNPVWKAYASGHNEILDVKEKESIAGGIRVPSPVRGNKLLALSQIHDIKFLQVSEDKILPGRDCLAQLGFYVEPTSAVTWDALSQVIGDVPEPIILILTGSGLKYQS